MDAIKVYLDKIKDIPLLSKEEEREAIIKAKNGNLEMRRKLINANLKLVVNIAKHYTHFDVPLMDLIAEGNIGLMRAIDKFNLKKGIRFSTYAAWWIRQSITRSLMDQAKTVRVPVYMNELIAKYKKTQEALWQKYNREPKREEIAKRLKMPIDKIAEIELWIQKKVSLETPIGEDGESQLSDFIETKNYADTEEEIERFMDKEDIKYFFTFISERERKVLDLRFGITDGVSHTLAEVAKILKISRERVRQIEESAINKLRKFVAEQEKKEVI